MAFTLRPYQQDAVEATIRYFQHQQDPALIVLPTGAGKSLVIAELARLAKGRVLVLAHVKELVEQNHQKYLAYDLDADIYAAGLNQKRNQTKVVFGSIQSIARNLDEFTQPFSLVIIDECHRISDDKESQYHQVITHLQALNPTLRILGLTATPFRLGKGWIYQYHYHGMIRGDETSFFRDCIYELPLRYMIKHHYLVEPKRLDMPLLHYDFSKLTVQSNGLFNERELNQSLRRQKRITPQIVKQIIDYASNAKGVMIFASTVEHASEIAKLLPVNEAALISANTPAQERDAIIRQFKAQQLRYLVNVSVLTTGFDAPHVDLIAILRPTESISLYQQIIGRGLRLAPGKTACLILDYAANGYDLFSPEVGRAKPVSDAVPVQVFCPVCHFANLFWGKCTSDGEIIEHFGRRCQGWQEAEDGTKQQCDFRFRFKNCPNCHAENDIAARKCHACQTLLVDPDDMLKAALALKGAMVLRCSGMHMHYLEQAKHTHYRITYFDEDGAQVSQFYPFNTEAQKMTFYQKFVLFHQRAAGLPIDWRNPQHLIAHQDKLFRHPDFVIARKQKQFWVVRDLVFDYEGRYRRANQLN